MMSVLEGPLVFVDIETTGVSYQRHRVIEVAAIRVENGVVIDTFSSLVDPESPLPPFITGLTGISDNDLAAAPSFYDIAEDIYTILEGAIFVAHNVRFDYGFLKREFSDTGRDFSPKLMCTVRLSRALYPEARGHKLQNLIDRCGLKAESRHRAYDDALAMWQFIQHVQAHFPAPKLEATVRRQLKSPSLPRGLEPAMVSGLPEGPGVYIFEDENGSPLYIGKSVNIKKRVMSHFSADHNFESEFKISQQVSNIEAKTTAGELQALLLESKLIKERQPLYNRQLRRSQKLTLARQVIRPDGFISIAIDDVEAIQPDNLKDILGVYTTKNKARQYLNRIMRDYGLCPKLMGLEKGAGACFSYQLQRCAGACAGTETADEYNSRLFSAFAGRRLEEWPYQTPILIEENGHGSYRGAIVVDQWCVIASLSYRPDNDPDIRLQEKMFDIDTYKILRSFLAAKIRDLKIKPISYSQLETFAA